MTILSTIMGVESGGGHNVTQSLGTRDVNNNYGAGGGDPAQGYFQITGGTWAQFGGLQTGYTQANQAPYAVQLQVAQNIPVARWGPATQNALSAAGYSTSRGQTLGQLMAANGENGSETVAADGSTLSGSGAVIANGPADTSSGLNAGPNATGTSVTQNPLGSSSAVSAVSGDQQDPPIKVALTTGTANAVQDWVNSFETSVGTAFTSAMTHALAAVGIDFSGIQNWFVRAGVILLGIVLVVAGIIALMWDHGGSDVVKEYTPAFAA